MYGLMQPANCVNLSEYMLGHGRSHNHRNACASSKKGQGVDGVLTMLHVVSLARSRYHILLLEVTVHHAMIILKSQGTLDNWLGWQGIL